MSAMLAHARTLGLLNAHSRQLAAFLRREFSASAAEPAAKNTYDVPEGHHNSDLSDTACHIGLGRRRDLTLRQDLALWSGDKKLSLADVFKGSKTLLVGFPGGKICAEQHLPGYVAAAQQLKAAGVDKVVAVGVGEPSALKSYAAAAGASSSDADGQATALPIPIQVLADRNASFVRLLGLEVGSQGQGPPCQRYAAVLDNGVLLRLKVESSPGELSCTSASSMAKVWQDAFA